MVSREYTNNACAKFRGTRKSIMVFFPIWPIEQLNSRQLSPEGEVNSGGYIPRREAWRYISTALHRP